MQSIFSTDYYVHFKETAFQKLDHYLQETFHSKVFILVDENTAKYCLPYFREQVTSSTEMTVVQIKAGEIYKNINTCNLIWQELTEKGADRKSILINLGGGVITDMGGFVASTFKRGIRFINIPTTLLSMVDASVGGKTGVDLGPLKNQIGLFSNPEMVLIDPDFLKTISKRQLRSGLAEILKYGFTFDKTIWEKIREFKDIDPLSVDNLIYRSIEIKNDVVLKDLKEQNLRKTLNFGHTIGHAIESYFLENKSKESLTHGESVAAGMIIETFFSSRLYNFPMETTNEIKDFTQKFFGKIDLREEDFKPVLDLMIYDKKNVNGKVNFVLLKVLENCVLDVQVDDQLLKEGLQYYID